MPTANCNSSCAIASTQRVSASFAGQVTDFFSGLFDTRDWPARWHCGTWSDFHGWLYILSDFTIWAAYFTIPLLLFRVLRKKRDIPFGNIYFLFVGFIFLCGSTHLIDALIFWWPAYRFSALMRFATAVISVATTYYLAKALPQIFHLKTVGDLEAEIRKRKEVEEKLNKSEQLYSEAVRISEIGTWEADLVTGENNWSKIVYDIFALPYDAPISEIDLFEFFPEPHKTKLKSAVACGTHWDLELEFITGENKVIWVRSIGEPVHDASGKIVKLKGTFMNIDKYKTTEIALTQLLSDVKEKKDQLKSFAHILSHNIRNHSTNIEVLTSLLEPDGLSKSNGEIASLLHKVSGNLKQTLDDLSTAIKVKDIPVAPDLISFAEMSENVLEVLQPEINKCDAKIELHFCVDSVRFPKIYFKSILLNLLSNAIKYRSPQRKLIVRLSSYKDKSGNTVLECRDNGLGIDLGRHGGKIFGLYKTFHGNEDAHGVGLFMAKTQIESQGGHIIVDSTIEKGSAFKIFFYEEV